jgi:predicted phosphoribosyltransferase
MLFANRTEAGTKLAEVLAAVDLGPNPIILGIPRGGVVVAAEVARAMSLPLDVAVAAKVGSPENPEYAIGAVTPDGEVAVSPDAGYTLEEVREHSEPAYEKVLRYTQMLRHGRPPLELAGRTAVIVDDGLATGLTAIAAAEWARRQGAARVVVAAPVAPPTAVRMLAHHADDVIVPETPNWFSAVGTFYHDFTQTPDSLVIDLLSEQTE